MHVWVQGPDKYSAFGYATVVRFGPWPLFNQGLSCMYGCKVQIIIPPLEMPLWFVWARDLFLIGGSHACMGTRSI